MSAASGPSTNMQTGGGNAPGGGSGSGSGTR